MIQDLIKDGSEVAVAVVLGVVLNVVLHPACANRKFEACCGTRQEAPAVAPGR
jgi:hypothetical protein